MLDTSGEAHRQAAGRGLHLIKPSLGELEDPVGRTLPTFQEQDSAMRDLIASGAAEIIALKPDGAGPCRAPVTRSCGSEA